MAEDRREKQNRYQVSDKPTSHQATDGMASDPAVEGHADGREEFSKRVSQELNAKSEFVREQERHAREHPARDRPDPPTGRSSD